MTTILPEYYFHFSCVGGRCEHSCCVDWEIDIDEDTYRRFTTQKSTLSERFCRSICTDGDLHFSLGEEGRCPFLNKNNLCDIVLAEGERALPEICREHPRFRNFYDDVTELGVGLCCDEAISLVLDSSRPLAFFYTPHEIDSMTDLPSLTFDLLTPDVLSSLPDPLFFEEKYEVLSFLGKTDGISLTLAHFGLSNDTSFDAPFDALALCEVLNLDFPQFLSHIRADMLSLDKKAPDTLARLCAHFFFRHASGECLYDMRTSFLLSLFLSLLSHALAEHTDCSLQEATRLVSSEIEYSTENEDILLSSFDL